MLPETPGDNSVATWLRVWAAGRAHTRETVAPVNTAYGCAVPSYHDRDLLRHVIVGDDHAQELSDHGERPISLTIVGQLDEWKPRLAADLTPIPDQMLLMVGPLDTNAPVLPSNYEMKPMDHGSWLDVQLWDGDVEAASLRCGLTDHPSSKSVVAVFDQVVTSPDHRRRGLASIMMKAAGVWAMGKGATSAVLSASEMGQKLYVPLGYSTICPMMACASPSVVIAPDEARAIAEARLAAIEPTP